MHVMTESYVEATYMEKETYGLGCIAESFFF